MNTCLNCGQIINENNKYCSLKCRNIYVNKNLRDYSKNANSLSKKAKDNYIKNPKTCIICGNVISYEKRKNKFCSKKCRGNSLIIWNNSRMGRKHSFSEKGLNNIKIATRKRHNISEKENEYSLKPNYCKECNNILSFEKRNHVFCTISCKRKYDRKNLTEYQKYYNECQFKFNLADYPNEFDFSLIEKYGWYQAKNHGNNLNGISRDHMISIKYGFENNISSEIIKHPANCKLMQHTKNSSKWKNSSIILNELLIRINDWNIKYNLPR